MKISPDDCLIPDMTIDEIMRRWPQTIHVLLSHSLLCVGCPIAGFHTISDACREHGLNEALLRTDIVRAIERVIEIEKN